jgi:type IV secretion system protein VirB1
MKIFFTLFILFLAQNTLLAFNNTYIANALKEISKKEDIDSRILYTIAQIESNFEPLVISMSIEKKYALKFKQIKNPNIKIKMKEYKYNNEKWIVNFYPKNLAFAKELARAFKKQNFSFDVGITQINTKNFKIEEIDYIFDPRYNILKSSKVLKECLKIKKDIKNTIECYNYGTKKRDSYPYYNRFKTTFLKNFGA